MEQNKSIENLSEAASLAEQMYIETQQVKNHRKTAVVLQSLTEESFCLNIKHVCMWASVM